MRPSNQPPLPLHPPPVDQAPPLPQQPPPQAEPPPIPQFLPPQLLPPQVPPPRHQEPADYEETEKKLPPSRHGSRPNTRSNSPKPATIPKSAGKRRPSYLASAPAPSVAAPPPPVAAPPPPTSALNLLDFLSSHSHQLPSQVTISYGISGNEFVSTSKTLNFHFLRNVTVATVRDPDSQVGYSVPCNSSIKFGLIYNPSPYDESASPYMQLKTVGDIIKLKQLPTVVTATTSYNGGAPEKSVAEGEILFVKGTVKGGTITKLGKQLQMVNAFGEEKQLSSKSAGSFSTDPRHTKVHLSLLLQQDIQWPQYVVLYPTDRELTRSLPASMTNSLVELVGVKGETSVIATPGENGNMGGDGSVVLNISITADLKVEPQEIGDQRSKEALTRASMQIYHTFTSSKAQFVMEKHPEKSLDLQRLFYQKILDENAEGVRKYLPSKDGPPPAIFDLKGHMEGTFTAAQNNNIDDTVSISNSVSTASGLDEHTRENDTTSVKPADTLSIGSSMSGRVTGTVSHSASGMNLCDSNAEADDEEQPIYEDDEKQAIYEDIDELCENMRKEADKEAATGGDASEEAVKEASKKSYASILSFLKKKTKGKKGKNKQSSDAYADVDFTETSASSGPVHDSSGMESAAPDPTPTHSRSSSESYDEMKPNSGYISDNYEECEFNAEPPSNAEIPATESLPPVASVPEPAAKKKLLMKSLKQALPDPDAAPPIGRDDLMLFKDKKSKMKERNLKRSDTLPRKMKLGSFVKKAPPISSISDFPANAKVTDINLSEQVWALTNQVERLKLQVKELTSAVEALTARSLPSQEASDGSQEASDGPPSVCALEENRKALKEMNLEQVLKLLDSLEIPQYKQTFIRKKVTGSVLAMVDEEILRNDLSITSKVHRARLLKIASGDTPVQDSKYVKFSR